MSPKRKVLLAHLSSFKLLQQALVNLLFLLFLVAACPEAGMAQSTSWTGTTSTNWRTASNWTSGVPDAATDAIIGDASFTGVFHPNLSPGPGIGSCKSLTVGAGSKITTFTITDGLEVYGTFTIGALGTVNDNNGRFTIYGDWINSGTYNASGANRRVYFAGTAQIIGGSSITDFSRLYINAGSTVTLSQNTLISNFISLSGTLDPQAFMVTGTGDINFNSSGILKVQTSTFSANYANTLTIDLGNSNPAVIDYASSTINQSIDNTITYRGLHISGGMTKTLAGNTSVRGDLKVSAGTLDLAGFSVNRSSSGGDLTLAGAATLRIGGTNTFPINYASHTIASTSTVEYYGGNQTVAAESYGNLTLSSTGGAVTKIMPGSAFTVAGNLTTSASAGTLTFTAGNNITVSGNITLGPSTSFTGSTFTHTVNGNWTNNGTYSGCGGTYNFNGAGASLSGSGVNNFGNVVINGSGTTLNMNTSMSVCGNFSTGGGGSFTHTADGTGNFTMTGATRTISGSNIIFNNLIINAGASISTTSTFTLAGNLTANGTLTATGGTITFSGTTKSITGSAAIQLAGVSISGSLSTARDVLISANVNVSGAFTASAGLITFNATSTLSGIANIFNVRITNVGTLTMGANAILGIAGTVTFDSGAIFNVTSNVPNTVNYNGSGAQSLVFLTFNNLVVSNGNTKTPSGALTINGSLTIGTSTTFVGSSFTHSLAGNWVNNGTFTANTSTIQFVGGSDASITGATVFNNLTINKAAPSNKITLINNVSAVNLSMTNGNMSTGANTMTITSTRTGNGIIIGRITRTHTFTTGIDYAFEGPNNFINFSSILGSVSSITVVVTIGPNVSFPSAASINRTYVVDVTSVSTYSATMRLHYEQAEVNGNSESAMTFWNDLGIGLWTDQSKTSNDVTDDWVSKSGIINLGNTWTISEGLIKYSWIGAVDNSWSNSSNWTPLGLPAITDVVHIGDVPFVNQPIVGSITQVKRIYFDSVTPSTLTIAGGGSLTVQGNIDGVWSADATHTIAVGSRSLTIFSDLVLGTGAPNRRINVTATTGIISINGSLTQTSGADILFTGAASMNVSGDYNYTSGTFTPATSTFTYNGINDQRMAGVTYYNLAVDKTSGTVLMNADVTVNNNFSMATGGQCDVQATLSVTGDIDIGANTVLNIPGSSTINIGGNWGSSGTFIAGSGSVVFNGTGAQAVQSTTFNTISVNKASGTLTLSGDLNVNSDINIQSGTVETLTHSVTRTTLGGTAMLGAGAVARFGGSNLQISNFASLIADPTSTIEFYTAAARVIPPITYGNLILTNGGSNAKTMVGPTTVMGTLTVNSGATLTAPTTTLTLGGDFTMNGTFNPSSGTLILNGANKNINGDIIYNNMVVNGSYDVITGSGTFNGYVEITPTGDFDAGSLTMTVNGDLVNAGAMSSDGIVTFSGNQAQTIRLLNAITSSSTGVVNFNGTVSPILNSTSSPVFATININNTAPIIASQPWTVAVAMNIANGATWNGGPLSHTFLRNFVNNGTVISSGTLSFNAASTATVSLGANFTTTGIVRFGGAGQINLSDSNPTFESLIILNTNAAGITPATNWSINQDVQILTGATFRGGALSHVVSGGWINNGVFDGQTSTITFNGTDGSDNITGSGVNNFNNLIFATGSVLDVTSDINVTSNLTNNAASLDLIDQLVTFQGPGLSVLNGSTVTSFDDLEVNKTGNDVRLDIDAAVASSLGLASGALVLNGNTLSVTNPDATAITRISGYIVSENTLFNSVLAWTIGSDLSQHDFPFGTPGGEYIPFSFEVNSGDAGVVSVSTYGTGADNLPLPPGVTEINDQFGSNNSANTVDRFYFIDLAGETLPDVNVTFHASVAEVGTISTLQAQRWSGGWDPPQMGQLAGATSVMVPNVTQFSPWAISGNNVPLPVELINFRGKQVFDQVVLQWETASELNNDYFEIQKSTDGVEFFAIDKVKGVGNSSTLKTYSYTDQVASSGNNYYRLKQVDFNKSVTVSKIIVIRVSKQEFEIKVFPNPSPDFITIVSNSSNEFTAALYDHAGRLVIHKKEENVKPYEAVDIDVRSLNTGTYILKMTSGRLIRTYKIMIE